MELERKYAMQNLNVLNIIFFGKGELSFFFFRKRSQNLVKTIANIDNTRNQTNGRIFNENLFCYIFSLSKNLG